MTKEKTVYLEYLDEFKSYGIPKSEIEALRRNGVVADIRFHKELYEKRQASRPTVGFLLGQDKGTDGTEYYTVGLTYAHSILNSGAKIRFLDYDNAYCQMKKCDGAIFAGWRF